MRKLLLLLLLTGVSTTLTMAQGARGTKYTAKLEGVVVLGDVDDKYNAQVYSLESPEPDGEADKIRLEEAKREVARRFPYKRDNRSRAKTTAAKSPVVVQAFKADSLSGIPPDNDMAISRSGKAISVTNSLISVLDGATGQMSFRTGLKGFSKTVGLNNIVNDHRYDPKVVYDSDADRFICFMLNSTNDFNYIVVGFSLSSDPEGAWSFYKFYGDYKSDTTWFDYPCISITKDEVFLTGNKIKFNTSWQAGFTETVIYQINKKDGYDSSATLNYKIWDGITYGGNSIRNLFPVKPGWKPMTNEQYFLSNRNFDVQNDTIFLVKVPGTLSNGGNLTVTALKAPKSYGVPPNGRQPDTSVVLATNDGRILGAYAIWGEIQFVSTSVHPVSGAAAVYHAKISNYETNPQVSHAEFISIDTLDFGYPNISFVGNSWGVNQSIISFNYTGPNEPPGMGAVLYDGIQYSDLVKIKTGDSSIRRLSGKEQRWGDYMGSQVDYNSVGTIWVEGIYGRADHNYGSWMAKLNSPVVGIEEKKQWEAQAKVYPNPAFKYIEYEFSMREEGMVTFSIYDLAGKLVDKILEMKCHEGKNLVRFNIGSLAAGTYVLKAVTDDDPVITRKFVKH